MNNKKCALANRSLSRVESVRRELEGERRLVREERDIPVERWIPRPGIDQCYDMKNLVSDQKNFKILYVILWVSILYLRRQVTPWL